MQPKIAFKRETPTDPNPRERKILNDLVVEDKLAEAIEYAESLVKVYPLSFMLFYIIGMTYILLAEHEKSEKWLEKAVMLNPKSGGAWRFLGECRLSLEQHADARDAFEKALNIDPHDSDSRRGMMLSSVDPKDFKGSIETLEEKVKQDPENPHLLITLGQCYLEEEYYNRAIHCLRKASELQPDDAFVMTLVGVAYNGFRKSKIALEWFAKAAEKEKPRPGLLLHMSTAAKDDGDFDQAIAYAKEAAALNPAGAEPKNHLAQIYTILGEKEKASELHRAVLKTMPGNLGAVSGLVHAQKVKPGDSSIELLENAYNLEPRNHFEEKSRMNIGFTLGKVYGDIGDYKKAIDVLKPANAKRRELIGFDLDNEYKQFDLIRHVFEPITPDDYVTLDEQAREKDRRMIFILGMPRSGTTLTEQIISSHSEVYGAGELNFMNEETGELMYMFGLQPHVKLEKVAFEHIRPKYLEHIDSLGMKERIVTDKLPHNFQRLGYILCCFPEATVIHLNRDPVAVCLSCFQKFFPARGMGFTFGLRDLGLYYGKYLEMMDYWRKKFPGRILDLDYKTLTEDQENQTRMLLDHCGLAWEDQCLDFHKTKRSVLTASQHQVREKMYKGSSETWKKYRDHIGELLDALDEAGVAYDKS